MSYDYIKAVDEIERLYPPERIAAAKARLAAVWSLQRPPDAIPSIFMGVPMGEGWPQGIGEAACPPDQTLEFRLESIIARAALDDDYVPSLNPGLRQGLIPTAYGAEEFWHEGHFWVKPLVRSAAEFLALPRPDFTRDGQAAEMLATTRFFRRATAGRLPVQMPDMQGPLDLASHFLGTQRLFEEMADHADDIHAMLAQLTDDFIAFMRLQEAAVDGALIPIHCHPVVWMPPGMAMALSEDMLAVISPRLYAPPKGRSLQRARGRCFRPHHHPFVRQLRAQPAAIGGHARSARRQFRRLGMRSPAGGRPVRPARGAPRSWHARVLSESAVAGPNRVRGLHFRLHPGARSTRHRDRRWPWRRG